jgi:hypothetical protein
MTMSQERAEEISKVLVAAIEGAIRDSEPADETAGLLPIALWRLTSINMGQDPGTLESPPDSELDYDQLKDDMVAARSIYEGLHEELAECTKGGPPSVLCETAHRAFPDAKDKAAVLIWTTDCFEGFDNLADAFHLMALAEQSQWIAPKTKGIFAVFNCGEAIALALKQKEMRLGASGLAFSKEMCIASLISPEMAVPYTGEQDSEFATFCIDVLRTAGWKVLGFLFDKKDASR